MEEPSLKRAKKELVKKKATLQVEELLRSNWRVDLPIVHHVYATKTPGLITFEDVNHSYFDVPLVAVADLCYEFGRSAALDVGKSPDLEWALADIVRLNSDKAIELMVPKSGFLFTRCLAMRRIATPTIEKYRKLMGYTHSDELMSALWLSISRRVIEKPMFMGVSNYNYSYTLGGDAFVVASDMVICRQQESPGISSSSDTPQTYYPERMVIRFRRYDSVGEREFTFWSEVAAEEYIKKFLVYDQPVTPCLLMSVDNFKVMPNEAKKTIDPFSVEETIVKTKTFSDLLGINTIGTQNEPRFVNISKLAKYGSLATYVLGEPRRKLGTEVGFLNHVELRSIAFQLIYTLAALDAVNMVHRDLTCSNILLDDYERAPMLFTVKTTKGDTQRYLLPRINGKTKLAIVGDYGRLVLAQNIRVGRYGGESNYAIIAPEVAMVTEKRAATGQYTTTHKTDIFALGIDLIGAILGNPYILLNKLVTGGSSIPGDLLSDERIENLYDQVQKEWPLESGRGIAKTAIKSVIEAFAIYYYMVGAPSVAIQGAPDYLMEEGGDVRFAHAMWQTFVDWFEEEMTKLPGFGWLMKPDNVIEKHVGKDFTDLLRAMVDWRPEKRPSAIEIFENPKYRSVFQRMEYSNTLLAPRDWSTWELNYSELSMLVRGLPIIPELLQPDPTSSKTEGAQIPEEMESPTRKGKKRETPDSPPERVEVEVKRPKVDDLTADCCCCLGEDEHFCDVCCLKNAHIEVSALPGRHNYVCSEACKVKYVRMEEYAERLTVAINDGSVIIGGNKHGELPVNDNTNNNNNMKSDEFLVEKTSSSAKEPILIPYKKVKKMMREKTIKGHPKSPAIHRLLGAMRSHYERGTPLKQYRVKKSKK